jgi:hypothetical protein
MEPISVKETDIRTYSTVLHLNSDEVSREAKPPKNINNYVVPDRRYHSKLLKQI